MHAVRTGLRIAVHARNVGSPIDAIGHLGALTFDVCLPFCTFDLGSRPFRWMASTSRRNLMAPSLLTDLLNGLDQLGGGQHAGFRPVHAKGFMYSGTFTPSSSASNLTRAAHATRSSTPITVRFSLAAGVPTAADNDPAAASPQGIAVRFHLDEHVHTDIVAHSHNGFPVRTGEEFLEFLKAVLASGPDAPESAADRGLPGHASGGKGLRRSSQEPIPSSFSRGRRISQSPPSSSRTRLAKAASAGFASCPRPGRSF